MLDLHTGENGYTENNVPLLVKDHAAYGTGNLPKFAEDLFHAYARSLTAEVWHQGVTHLAFKRVPRLE